MLNAHTLAAQHSTKAAISGNGDGHANAENIESSFEYVNKFDRFSTLAEFQTAHIQLLLFSTSPFLALAASNMFIRSFMPCVVLKLIFSISAAFSFHFK